ncbi:hypothetical protein METBIDRAFT_202763 [Metschnikowia bicuspidata var. bicuspidata NRRL YB-4993]|uniref:non-specific serine/threonine protein kinase n=1 Tax=Metschnikowia bicuspidata var. bicuspidata NRRL YB-4993 TaxID=869754 RepID=A0A1A0H9X4_9ASCO|nr:hypothetical protein METBIDRAFT_202763 [Metschnikowia bicuspidata var. bicuspidata NRRL YB-4993]OBA20673.1 hypothetical protein METBIDRAFT_202763 [Metschnikowia bicuspidata var. bicuspidata NRRL YB-4993]
MKDVLRQIFHPHSFRGQARQDAPPTRRPQSRAALPGAGLQEQLALRLASAENPAVVMELDMDGRLLYVSKSWERLVGTLVAQLLGRPIGSLLVGSTAADLTVFSDAVTQMAADNASYKVKFVTATNGRAGGAGAENGPRDESQDGSQDESHDGPWGESQDGPLDESQDGPLDESHDGPLDESQDGSQDESQDGPLDESQDGSQDESQDGSQDESHDGPWGESRDAPGPPGSPGSQVSNDGNVIELEAQGIVICHPQTGVPTHSIWTVRPFVPLQLALSIPAALTDLLGFGAEIFEGYLASVREAGIIDERAVPPPKLLLCRICETSFPAWFIEKHSELCLLEHKVEEEVQFCHDAIAEQRELVVRLAAALLPGRPLEYRDMPLAPPQPEPSGDGRAGAGDDLGSRLSGDDLGSRLSGNVLARLSGNDLARLSGNVLDSLSGNVQTSLSGNDQAPLLQKLVDFCDDALLINAAERQEATGAFAFSPNTERALQLVRTWPPLDSPDPALQAMVADTRALVAEKADKMARLLSLLQYSEKIKQEVDDLVVQAVADTVALIREKTRQHESDFLALRRRALPLPKGSPASSPAPPGCLPRPLQTIHSPQPSRVRSPTRSLLGDDFASARRLQSFTPQDLLAGSPSLIDSRTSISPNTSLSKLPAKDLARAMDAMDLSLDSLDASPLHSAIPSPRLHLSPAPYVEKPGLSGLQRNTTARCNQHTPPRPLSGDYSLAHKKMGNRARSSSNLLLPPLSKSDMSPHIATVPMAPPSSSNTPTSAPRGSFSSPRPPLSPLLVSQPASQKAATGGIRDYEILKAISKGAYGSVFLAKRRLTGDYVAIKCLKKGDMIAKNQVLNVRAERAVMMKQTDSPYVAQLHCSFQSKDYLYLVMEYLNGGDCATLLKMLGTLGDKWAKRYIAEVIVGVEDLHQRDIIHRDLKPDNLLIDSHGHLKLTDFGLSRIGVLGRHTYRHRKSSASEHGIELFRRSINNNSLSQSPLVNSIAVESPDLIPNTHKRNLSVTPFSLSPATDQHKFNLGPHGHLTSISSYDSAIPAIPNTKKKSISHFRASSNRSGSASSSIDSPNLRPVNGMPPSESSFALLDDGCEFLMSPSQNEESINSFTLFDPTKASDKVKKFVGTPDYLAPETIKGEIQGEYSDWWSIGCILFEFVYGYPPFHASTPEKVFQNILSGEIDWPALSEEEDLELCAPEAKDLIRGLLTLDYEHRLGYNGAEEIMEHPYFKDIDWNNLYLETPDSFIPILDGPESTEYFDLRGADISQFPQDDPDYTEIEPLRTDLNSDSGSPGTYLSMPSTPTSVKRERRGSKLADTSEFGSFNFRNLNVLEKANKDVINRLKSEHLEHRSSISSSSSESFTPGHNKSRGLSISSNIVNLGSPFKRPVSPAPIANVPLSPGKEKFPTRLGSKKWDSTTTVSTASTGRSLSLARSFSRQVILRTADDLAYSPSSSDNEENATSLYRAHNRKESLRRMDSSASGSSHGTQGTHSPQKEHATFVAHDELDVLYCEPIPIVRHTVSKLMEKQGCIVLPIADGEDLIRRATSKVKFDLIFTALRLAKIEAADAVRLIKCTSGVNANTPIIAITGFAKEALDLGIFDDVLEKPVDGSMIQSLIHKFQLQNVAVESDPED